MPTTDEIVKAFQAVADADDHGTGEPILFLPFGFNQKDFLSLLEVLDFNVAENNGSGGWNYETAEWAYKFHETLLDLIRAPKDS